MDKDNLRIIFQKIDRVGKLLHTTIKIIYWLFIYIYRYNIHTAFNHDSFVRRIHT